jgi:superfamily II DNA/RNA helicase
LALAMKLLKNPSRIAIGATTQPIGQVEENTIHTTREKKTDLVVDEVNARAGKVLVFTRTKSRADRLARVLFAKGHQVVCLHGGRSQGQRKQALERFRTGSHRIMVATDLAGRGIDVADIEHVINYDLPANREDYIHRIGRTGRFGKKGQALNLLENGDSEGEEVITGIKAKRGAVRSLPTGGRSSAPRRRQNSFGRNSSAGRPEKRSFGRR